MGSERRATAGPRIPARRPLALAGWAAVFVTVAAIELPGSSARGADTAANAQDDVLAHVHGEAIARPQVERQLAQTRMERIAKGHSSKIDENERLRLTSDALEALINEVILDREVARRKITVDDDSVVAAVYGAKTEYEDTIGWREFLKGSGLTVEEFRAQARRRLARRQLINDIRRPAATPTRAQLREFYDSHQDLPYIRTGEEVAARHVLVTVAEGDDEATRAEKRKRAETIRQELIDGADFAETAKEKSDCPSAKRGGDLGSFGRGRMVKPFEEAAFGQDEGVIGPVVETRFGYHIIRTEKKFPAKTRSFDEVAGVLARVVGNKTSNDAVTDFFKKLRENATVEYTEAGQALIDARDAQ